MIVTGIFLFLLGTKIGKSSAVQADVKYEPSKISIKEQIDQSPIMIPELGSPPYFPSFIHQGSNYFFGAPFPMQPGFVQMPPRKETIEITKEEYLVSKPSGKETPPFTNPVIKEEPIVSHPNVLPPVSVPVITSQPISPSLNIPAFPIVKCDPPYISSLTNKPILPPKEVIVSEVDVLVKEIPPPPELPPLDLSKIFKPIIVEEREIILVPSPPEVEVMFPPAVVARKPCAPTKCARNILFERVLPNIACDKSKTVELISIPASERNPVIAKSFLPYIVKH